MKGSYTFVGFAADRKTYVTMFAGRDPWGIKPGFIGHLDDGWAVASEDAALVTIGCEEEDIMEMERGKFYTMEMGGELDEIVIRKGKPAFCAFEYVYFGDIASNFNGQNVGAIRKRLGRQLGIEQPVKADIVVPIPDSGRSAAVGYAYATGMEYEEAGLSKNRKSNKRTFILQDQRERDSEVLRKMIPVKKILEGRRVVLVDDSLVRGTTMRKLVDKVREVGGAEEVHVRISCPPTIAPCYLGIDMKGRGEFAAARAAQDLGFDFYGGFKDPLQMGLDGDKLQTVVTKVRDAIDADSLGYLSMKSFRKITGGDCCFGCWNPALNPDELRDDILRFIKEHPEGERF
jgi:amidophosphoribosyltransferase